MRTWRMAIRNIWRAKRRSLITMLAMTFALAIMVIYSGLSDGFVVGLERMTTMVEMGHIQIHAEGYRKSPSIYKRIPELAKVVSAMHKLGYKATYRLYASGLAAKDKASSGVHIRGVDPDLEAATTQLAESLLKGGWLDERDAKGVVIGKGLARTLTADIGSELVLVSQAADGSLANDLYNVRGILKSVGEGFDRSALIMTARSFRELMVLPEGAQQLVVVLPENAELDSAKRKISALFGDLDVKTWKELNPALSDMLTMTDAFLIPTIVIFYTALAILVLNAMLMAVFERIREYGVMRAVGITPWGIFALVLSETCAMVTISAVAGVLLGLPVSFHLEKHGIDLAALSDSMTMAGVAIGSVWPAVVSPKIVIVPVAALYVLAVIASAYPALKAASLNPVDAMRHH